LEKFGAVRIAIVGFCKSLVTSICLRSPRPSAPLRAARSIQVPQLRKLLRAGRAIYCRARRAERDDIAGNSIPVKQYSL